VEPLPEVAAAIDQLAAETGDTSLLDGLLGLAGAAVDLVPSCVAVSLTIVVDDEPFTVTATSAELAVLDAAQYLEGGPCLEATRTAQEVDVPDVLDEDRWRLYEQVASARGIRSSLSMPVGGSAGRTPGAVNLYASDPHAFTGKEEQLAEVFQVPVEEMVANADLSFMTRDFARELPERLEEKSRADRAVGVLVARNGWGPDEARTRLRAAAGKAGVALGEVASVVLALSGP
jgi:GAF domain-containing protein